jgi:hypothetical protein
MDSLESKTRGPHEKKKIREPQFISRIRINTKRRATIAPNGRIAALAGLALTGLACGVLFSSVRQPSQTAGSTVNDLLKGAIPDTPRML